MFRDSKEYQEIAKIYADKVSKPENLDENRNTRGSELAAKRLADKPPVSNEPKIKPQYQQNRDKLKITRTSNKPKTREEVGLKNNVVKKPSPFERKFGSERNQQRLKQSGLSKPSTAEIRAKNAASGGSGMSNIPSKEGNAVIGGKKINPDFGKKVEIKKEPVKKMHPIEKKNRERLGDARVDALKKKNAEFQAAKKSGNLAQFRKDNPKLSGADRAKQMAKERLAKKAAMEEFTPYDIVLEYLLSSKQAATIEEANYIMTEMDAETIQSIVSD
jgi:hypothetical protein